MIELENEIKSLRQQMQHVLCYIDTDELRAIGRIAKLTPPIATLRLMAAENPPPAEWFKDDE